MYDALMTLMEKILNVAGNLVVFVFLFQWGVTTPSPKGEGF